MCLLRLHRLRTRTAVLKSLFQRSDVMRACVFPLPHPKAIDGGSSDPPSHQQSANGREGHLGGSQGKMQNSLCAFILFADNKLMFAQRALSSACYSPRAQLRASVGAAKRLKQTQQVHQGHQDIDRKRCTQAQDPVCSAS